MGIAIQGFGNLVAIATPTATCGVSSIVTTMVYNLRMLVNLGVGLSGTLIFLFIFWKRLKEDYASDIVFKSATYILACFLLGYVLSLKYLPQAYLYFIFLGVLIGVWLTIFKLKIKFYELTDAVIIAFLPWLSLTFFKDSIQSSSFVSFIAFLYVLLIIFLYYYFDTHYKEFSWYKSGKVGFSGMAALAIIFLTRSLVAVLGISVLSFVGRFEGIIAGALAFAAFLLLYNLGRKTQ